MGWQFEFPEATHAAWIWVPTVQGKRSSQQHRPAWRHEAGRADGKALTWMAVTQSVRWPGDWGPAGAPALIQKG